MGGCACVRACESVYVHARVCVSMSVCAISMSCITFGVHASLKIVGHTYSETCLNHHPYPEATFLHRPHGRVLKMALQLI